MPGDLKDEPSASCSAPLPTARSTTWCIRFIGPRITRETRKTMSSRPRGWRPICAPVYHDTVRTLRHPDVPKRPTDHESVAVFDLEQGGRDQATKISTNGSEIGASENRVRFRVNGTPL